MCVFSIDPGFGNNSMNWEDLAQLKGEEKID